MNRTRFVRVLLLIGACGIAPAHAQQPPSEPLAAEPVPFQLEPDRVSVPAHPAFLAVGGITGGLVGVVAGGYAGAAIELAGGCHSDFCGLGGALLGAAVGEVLLLPLGVHLFNSRQGSYASDALVSLGVAAGGLALVAVGQGQSAGLLFAIPVVQLIGVISTERSTSRSR